MKQTYNDSKTVRETFDELNQRVYLKEIKCSICGEWFEYEEIIWVPKWSDGKPYCVACAPEELYKHHGL